MGYYGPMGFNGMFGGFGLIFMLFFWILVFVALFLLVRALVGHHKCECATTGRHAENPSTRNTSSRAAEEIKRQEQALQEMNKKMEENPAFMILQQRYAKGEISKEEYSQIKRDLMS